MAFFQLMLKANKLEKARLAYQDEKLRSIEISRGDKVHYTLSQKIRRKKIILKRKLGDCLKKCTTCPEDSWFHQKSVLLRTEGTFENFILKSILGFLSGMFLTYMFFMFFVFQLNFTLSSATMLCSLFGIILTIGLAFSYRVRCVVFLLLPQFFSKRGRQALMAYAFILALTGPAKNTLHNTGVLSESLACGQEQLKEAVKSIVDLVKQPFYALRDAISKVIKTVKVVVRRIKQALLAIKRMILSILRVVKAVFQWLGSVVNICNKKLGTPFERCQRSFEGAVSDCYAKLGPIFGTVCNLAYVVGTLCYIVKPLDFICILVSFVADTIVGEVRKKIKKFTKHMTAMFYVKVKFSHSFHFETNKSRNLQDISTGIVTEIRSRTDRFLTVFDWMSFATSFFVLFMLLRVIHYRQKWLTNERFDNRYLTEDLRHIDLIRAKRDKETVLPLNPREKNKYISLTSISLIRVEKIKLTKSAVFLGLTTFKLCIHMMADYSLYWVLSTIRYHGRFETKVQRTNAVGVYVSGNGYLAELYRSIVRAFSPMGTEMEMDTVPCLPDPVPPDLDRYTQIVSLILFSWIMAIFEPYGLRLRHVVMTYYHPQRAQQRAVWLYNHIIRSRGSFVKYARRQLRRKFGMNDGKAREDVTFKERLFAICPILNNFFQQNERNCLLCGTVERENQLPHVKCPTPDCIGLFCTQCFADLQNLCTICLAPMDYGDLSDMSEERDSSDDQLPSGRKKVKKIVPMEEIVPRKETIIPRKETIVPEEGTIVEEVEEKEEPIKKPVKLSIDESTQATDETGEDVSSTDYSQTYQDEEPEGLDFTKERRVHYKDVEAQKQRDDVTIQIFNEPLRDDATSGEESPTSCFVVRAHRRLRSRLKRDCRSCPSRDCSSSSSSSSIADTESLSTEEVEEDEVIHIEIEDDSDKGDLGAGGSKILTKKPGRLGKIVNALSRVSWLKKKSEMDSAENGRGIERRRSSLMNKVLDLLHAPGPPKPVRTYKHTRRSKSDGEKYEECHCSSSSSESSFDDDEYEKRALVKSPKGSKRKRDKRSKSRKKKRGRSRDYGDDYIYETSWESHRQRGGSDTPRIVSITQPDGDRYARRIRAMSKGTKYSEINEKDMNKLSDGKSSTETGRTEETWNITETEDKQDTTSSYTQSSRGDATETNAHTMGMSTIEEDSEKLSTTDNRTDNEDPTSKSGTNDDYVDVTGLSGTTTDTSSTKEKMRKKRVSKYVTDEELKAVAPAERKRRKTIIKRRREERSDKTALYDPLAGLEIYGLHDKRKRRKKKWADEETTETEKWETKVPKEKHTEKTEEDTEKTEGDTEKSERDTKKTERDTKKTKRARKLKEPDTTTETHTEFEKIDTGTETSETEAPKSKRTEGRTRDETDRGRRICVKRLKKDKCRKHRRRKRREKKEKPEPVKIIVEAKTSPDTSIQQQTEVGKNCCIRVQPEEWFYQEQRQLWEQMCSKMAEYSHRYGCPSRYCHPTPCFPHDGCTIPMYNPNLFHPPLQGHSCPRFLSGPQDQNCGPRIVPPVLKRFLPKYQRPDIVDQMKCRDRARLRRDRDERRRKCDCGQMTTVEKDHESFSRNILSRPSIIPERTDVLPYQESESFKDVLQEYKTTIPQKIDETSREGGETDEEYQEMQDEQEPLISLSRIADNSKDLQQLFPPPETKRRSSAIAQFGNRIASVFKNTTWRKSNDVTADRKIADSESWSEMSIVENSPVERLDEPASADETTDNNETTE